MYAYKNGELEGLALPGRNATVYYFLNDAIAFTAYPYLLNSIISVCDVPFTECNTQSGYSFTVIGQLPQKMVATFTNHTSNDNTPAPTPVITPPPGTQPGYQPIDFETRLNSFGALITDFNNALGAGTKLLLALIVIIGLTWNLRMPGLIAGVIISALFWIPIWITVLGTILIIVVVIYTRSNYYER